MELHGLSITPPIPFYWTLKLLFISILKQFINLCIQSAIWDWTSSISFSNHEMISLLPLRKKWEGCSELQTTLMVLESRKFMGHESASLLLVPRKTLERWGQGEPWTCPRPLHMYLASVLPHMCRTEFGTDVFFNECLLCVMYNTHIILFATTWIFSEFKYYI